MSCDPKGNHKSCLIYLSPQDVAVNANQTHDTSGNAQKASRAAGSLRSLCTRVTWDPLNLTLDKSHRNLRLDKKRDLDLA